jgi:hypothetical protein
LCASTTPNRHRATGLTPAWPPSRLARPGLNEPRRRGQRRRRTLPYSGHKQPRRRGPDAPARTKAGLAPRVAAHLLFAKPKSLDLSARRGPRDLVSRKSRRLGRCQRRWETAGSAQTHRCDSARTAPPARRSHSRRAIVPTGREPAMPMPRRHSSRLGHPDDRLRVKAATSTSWPQQASSGNAPGDQRLPLRSWRTGTTSPRRYLCRSVIDFATARAPHSATSGAGPPFRREPSSSPISGRTASSGLRPRPPISSELRFGMNSGATPAPTLGREGACRSRHSWRPARRRCINPRSEIADVGLLSSALAGTTSGGNSPKVMTSARTEPGSRRWRRCCRFRGRRARVVRSDP